MTSAEDAPLIARSRANVEQSRWLCERARRAIATSARLCPAPIAGASDANAYALRSLPPAKSDHDADPGTRRAVLVLAHDPLMRVFIADAIRSAHEITEAADVPTTVKIIGSGARFDVVVMGSFTFGDAWGVATCTGLARSLYEECPWIPVVIIADTPPPTLRADLLLTGVRTFLPRDFTSDQLASTVARVGRRPDAPVPTTVRVAAIKHTFAVLERAITDVPALAVLARMAAMSRSHFSRTFHAVAGISLRDYVRDLRLKHAQELMRASRLSLSSIATASGFYDLPHFNKAFRHRFGMSPTQFRLASLPPPSSSSP
jgi:AraC-like DNA-binding protein